MGYLFLNDVDNATRLVKVVMLLLGISLFGFRDLLIVLVFLLNGSSG